MLMSNKKNKKVVAHRRELCRSQGASNHLALSEIIAKLTMRTIVPRTRKPFVREPVLWIAVSYPSYQIWLALVSDGAGALARVLLSIPVGAACMAAALAVLPRLWRKAGADA